MKEIKDIHLKVDAVMHLFDQVISTVPYEHFAEWKDEIIEKVKDEDKIMELNNELASTLIETCIVFLYEDVLSKQKFQFLREEILNHIDEEISALNTERGINIERLFVKHLNAMDNYSNVLIENLANNIKINIK
jgi:uncharacterized protein YjgD (DUF1641 family)